MDSSLFILAIESFYENPDQNTLNNLYPECPNHLLNDFIKLYKSNKMTIIDKIYNDKKMDYLQLTESEYGALVQKYDNISFLPSYCRNADFYGKYPHLQMIHDGIQTSSFIMEQLYNKHGDKFIKTIISVNKQEYANVALRVIKSLSNSKRTEYQNRLFDLWNVITKCNIPLTDAEKYTIFLDDHYGCYSDTTKRLGNSVNKELAEYMNKYAKDSINYYQTQLHWGKYFSRNKFNSTKRYVHYSSGTTTDPLYCLYSRTRDGLIVGKLNTLLKFMDSLNTPECADFTMYKIKRAEEVILLEYENNDEKIYGTLQNKKVSVDLIPYDHVTEQYRKYIGTSKNSEVWTNNGITYITNC